MNKLLVFLLIVICTTLSCTGEETIFREGDWWEGHWQNVDDASLVFSSGSKKVGANEITTPQFFISQNDSILDNFHLKELEEYDHRSRFKVILTDEDSFIKIQEINESSIEVQGPAPSLEDLESNISEYIRLPENIEPPIPDSILFGR